MNPSNDRLRALNVPKQVQVELDAGKPIVVRALRKPNDERRVAAIGEVWRIDDEWWRMPIKRQYVEAILEDGARVVLFEDQITGEWFAQMPA